MAGGPTLDVSGKQVHDTFVLAAGESTDPMTIDAEVSFAYYTGYGELSLADSYDYSKGGTAEIEVVDGDVALTVELSVSGDLAIEVRDGDGARVELATGTGLRGRSPRSSSAWAPTRSNSAPTMARVA